jgi:hypothetical protein
MNLNTVDEERISVWLCLFILVLYIWHAFQLDGSYEGGDGVFHYLISRGSWHHPEKFLSHWGKPFYTLLASPFAQFGLIGVKFFNALAGVFSIYFLYRIAKLLSMPYAPAVIILGAFPPVYMMCINSGLTEPVFGLVLTVSVYLFLRGNYLPGAMIVSFLPFCRTEGYLLIPLFGIILLLRKRFRVIPFLAFGTLIYTLVGYPYYQDWLWLVHQNPYSPVNAFNYGKGTWNYFLLGYDLILGLPVAILVCLGIVGTAAHLFRKGFFRQSDEVWTELILIQGAFFVYFAAHSLFWYYGIFGSMGLVRTIAAVTPMAALIGLRGIGMVYKSTGSRERIFGIFLTLFLLWVIYYPYYLNYIPLKLPPEEELVVEAGNWFNESEYSENHLYYGYPRFIEVVNRDAFDKEKSNELWNLYPVIKEWGIDVIPENTIVVWDAHFGINECGITLEKILNDTNFRLIKVFNSKVPINTLGDNNFTIYMFVKQKLVSGGYKSGFHFDLEKDDQLQNAGTITGELPFSGKRSSHVKASDEYGVGINITVSSIENSEAINWIEYRFKMYTMDGSGVVKAVLAVNDSINPVYWSGRVVNTDTLKKWTDVSFVYRLSPGAFNEQSVFQLYTLNDGNNEYFIDDISVKFW